MYNQELADRIERLAVLVAVVISVAAPVLIVLGVAAHQS
jgi:hypothetical protein